MIQIYRVEEFEDYFFYFIDAADNMVGEISYIPGTLDIYNEFYQIDNSEIIDIFEQLLDGLDALHAAQLLHRDIKLCRFGNITFNELNSSSLVM